MGGESSKMQWTYTRWVQMCDTVMCEDIAAYYKRGPLYFITSQQSSPPFSTASLRGVAGPQPLSLVPTRGAFIVQFAFSPFYALPCVIGFRAHRLAKVARSQWMAKRIPVSRDSGGVAIDAILSCRRAPVSIFTVHNKCKPVWGKTLLTCCEIAGVGLI